MQLYRRGYDGHMIFSLATVAMVYFSTCARVGLGGGALHVYRFVRMDNERLAYSSVQPSPLPLPSPSAVVKLWYSYSIKLCTLFARVCGRQQDDAVCIAVRSIRCWRRRRRLVNGRLGNGTRRCGDAAQCLAHLRPKHTHIHTPNIEYRIVVQKILHIPASIAAAVTFALLSFPLLPQLR